jgi:hypothetical protein
MFIFSVSRISCKAAVVLANNTAGPYFGGALKGIVGQQGACAFGIGCDHRQAEGIHQGAGGVAVNMVGAEGLSGGGIMVYRDVAV